MRGDAVVVVDGPAVGWTIGRSGVDISEEVEGTRTRPRDGFLRGRSFAGSSSIARDRRIFFWGVASGVHVLLVE